MTDPFLSIACAVGLFAASWALTGFVRRYAMSVELLDTPNARSSHTMPTPRGGGLAIVATFLAFVTAVSALDLIAPAAMLALLGGGFAVAMLGFLDDRAHVGARWRFLSHLAAAVWVLWCFDGIPPVPILGMSFDLAWFGLALAAAYLVWMVNLYNFMDGIDGIASIEAITVSLGGALAWWIATGSPQALVPVGFAASVAGFLLWNFPPAKIFMGDSGSGFIGLMIGIFSFWSAQEHTQVFWCWFILTGCFMVDATTTLVRRVRRGERFIEAHRSHAYQYAARRHQSHKRVSIAVGAINLLWLLPIALAVAAGVLDGVVGVIVAYTPLVWLAFRYKAGVRSAQEV